MASSSPTTIRQTGEKSLEVVGYSYDPQVWNLLEALDRQGWVDEDRTFQWTKWMNTEEAMSLMYDSAARARATPQQFAKLLTVFARQERFIDEAMLNFWKPVRYATRTGPNTQIRSRCASCNAAASWQRLVACSSRVISSRSKGLTRSAPASRAGVAGSARWRRAPPCP
ncbi:DUF6508 domain-containing protein [Deinococcus aestuarii]|uniref:DUF6508 domain-containing protein n=1 Tax=Deinococcus aestuarii TaxID=2774531 RepID=UPI003CCE9D5D